MIAFTVTIRTIDQFFKFSAIGKSSSAVHAAALELFDVPCSAAVIPTPGANHAK